MAKTKKHETENVVEVPFVDANEGNTQEAANTESAAEIVVEQKDGTVDVDLGLPKVPIIPEDVLPLNWQKAIKKFSEEEQQEIADLSAKIDVTKIENVMLYGSAPLKETFDQCGKFLKDERGSQADQAVIAQVIELSKKATSSYDDFNLVLQEPNLFQKILLKLSSKKQKTRSDKIQKSAVSNYKLLGELKSSCESWLEMLQKAWGDSASAIINDAEVGTLLDKYIIAGYMAEDRIKAEIADAKAEYEETGLMPLSQKFDELSEGYKIFQMTMANLEKSRAMYQLSLGQLRLVKHSNENVQISLNTQMNNTLTLLSQQLRNAVLDAKTREVLEGQKALTRLNDEVIKDVSRSIGCTAEQTERLLYTGVYNVEAAKEAINTVITSCKTIQKTAADMLPKMQADVVHINKLIEELEPCVENITQSQAISKKVEANNPSQKSATATGGGKLEF